MTLQALPTQPTVWIPTVGYHCAALQEDSKARSISAVEDGSDEYWDEWWAKCDSVMRMQVPHKPPLERLARYLNKPVMEAPPVPPQAMLGPKGEVQLIEQPQPPRTGSWLGQKGDFPQDFAEDMTDWVQLEPVSMRRDQVMREIAGFELLMAGQQGMAPPPELTQAPPTSGVADELPALPWTPEAPPA